MDEVFSSASRAYGNKCIAIILSGMGKDGTKGLVDVKANGGKTYAQKRSSCVAPSMPTSAINEGVIEKELTLIEIARSVLNKLEC